MLQVFLVNKTKQDPTLRVMRGGPLTSARSDNALWTFEANQILLFSLPYYGLTGEVGLDNSTLSLKKQCILGCSSFDISLPEVHLPVFNSTKYI